MDFKDFYSHLIVYAYCGKTKIVNPDFSFLKKILGECELYRLLTLVSMSFSMCCNQCSFHLECQDQSVWSFSFYPKVISFEHDLPF